MRRAGGAASRATPLHRRTFTGTAHGMRYRGSPGVLGVGFVVVRKSSAARAASLDHSGKTSILKFFIKSRCTLFKSFPACYNLLKQ